MTKKKLLEILSKFKDTDEIVISIMNGKMIVSLYFPNKLIIKNS